MIYGSDCFTKIKNDTVNFHCQIFKCKINGIFFTSYYTHQKSGIQKNFSAFAEYQSRNSLSLMMFVPKVFS